MPDTYEIALRKRLDHIEAQLGQLLPRYVSNPAGVPPEIVELVRAGKRIEAMHAYQKHAGVEIAEAKAVIDKV